MSDCEIIEQFKKGASKKYLAQLIYFKERESRKELAKKNKGISQGKYLLSDAMMKVENLILTDYIRFQGVNK